MERYPLSTHSRDLEITSGVFGLCVIGFSYLVTANQGLIGSLFDDVREKVVSHGAQRSGKVLVHSDTAATLHRLGRWRADGPYIVSDSGSRIRINGINWSGFETTTKVLGGLDRQDYKAILNAIKRAGFNVVRIPYSNAMVENPPIPDALAFYLEGRTINEDLKGLNSLELMDKVIAYSGSIGLRIILDNHRSSAGGGPQENGLWFTDDIPESSWIDDWLFLARRYKNQDAVVGFDLRNEPHSVEGGGACWSCGGKRDWHHAAERAGNAILEEDPSKLIIVEGVDRFGTDATWWGGNLEGVKEAPVQLSLANHLVYSAHEYGPEEHSQPWFTSKTSSSSLLQLWNRRWGFIGQQKIAPVYLGEFGTSFSTSGRERAAAGSQAQWFNTLTMYLSEHPEIGWSYWSANAEDRYAFFDLDYDTARAESDSLKDLMAAEKDVANRAILFLGPDQSLSCAISCSAKESSESGHCSCAASISLGPVQPGEVNRRQASYIADHVKQATQKAISSLQDQNMAKRP